MALISVCVVAAAGGVSGQTPAAPTISAVHAGDAALTVLWTAPSGVTGITAYDLRIILTSADETVDANWTVPKDVWTEGPPVLVPRNAQTRCLQDSREYRNEQGTPAAAITGGTAFHPCNL